MKKLLIVLALVLCMALPAFAQEHKSMTVTDDDGMTKARTSFNNGEIDEIIISGKVCLGATEQGGSTCGLYISQDKTLTLQINKGCELKVSGAAGQDTDGIYNKGGNLTVVGEGSLVVVGSNNKIEGVYVKSGTANIDSGVSISASSDKGAYGVSVKNSSTVNIGGGASISASSSSDAYGVYVGTSTANILSADISATASNPNNAKSVYVDSPNGSLTVYAGTFSDDEAQNHLGPDSIAPIKSGDKYVVTNSAKITFTPASLDVTQGESGVISVDFCVSFGITSLSIDKLEVTPASVDGITVEPSSKDGTITFDVEKTCKTGTYPFSVFCKGGDSDGTHLQTETFTVTVSEAQPEPTPAPVEPFVSKDQLPENVVSAKATTSISVDEIAQVISSDFTSSDLTTDNSGNVTVKPEVAAEAIGNTLGKEVASDDVLCFPVASVSENSDRVGKVIMFTFAVSGDKLTYASSDPSKLRVYKLLNSEEAEAFTYAASPSVAADKTFTVQNENGTDATTIENGKTYLVSAYVKDNDTFDLDHQENGGIIDPIAIDTSGTTPSSSSGSASNGGCNAGFGAAVLAVSALIAAAKRRKK